MSIIFGSSDGEKKCKKCGETFKNSRENFGSTPSGGLRNDCRKCVALKSKEYNSHPNRIKNTHIRSTTLGEKFSKTDSSIKKYIWNIQGKRCAYTGVSISLQEAVVDHRISLAKGGLDQMSNLAVCHRQVNAEKHAKTDAEYFDWRRKKNLPCTEEIAKKIPRPRD